MRPVNVPQIKLVLVSPMEYCEIEFQHRFPADYRRLSGSTDGKAVLQDLLEGQKKAVQKAGNLFRIINDDEKVATARKGVCVGVCGLKIAASTAHLFGLSVFPKYRKNGFALAARLERERIAKEQGASVVTADVSIFNLKQRRRLKRGGYKRKGILPKRWLFHTFQKHI